MCTFANASKLAFAEFVCLHTNSLSQALLAERSLLRDLYRT